MMSNNTCIFTPPLSPNTLTNNNEVKQNVVKKGKVSGNVYPSYKSKHPQNLRIRTIGISDNRKKVSNNSTSSTVYPMLSQMSATENQKSSHKVKDGANKFHEDMEKIMENTNLICSFLKTVCVGLPIDDSSINTNLQKDLTNDQNKKSKIVSLENFVANILLRTKLTSSFVYVALLFIHRYLNKKQEDQRSIVNVKESASDKVCKKNIYIPKNLALKLSHCSKNHHGISKSDTKVKLNQQSLNYLLQQCQPNKKSNKKSENIVYKASLPKETYIKTQKDLIFAAMILSSKYLDDNSYCNSAWVKLTNKTLKEVSELEREFLMSLDYKFYISNEEWKEWHSWISHFRVLLDAGMSSNIVENQASPSCMITIPSQSNQYYQNNNYLPSPIDINTPTSATFSSKIPFSFDEEIIMNEEKESYNYPEISGNNFFPPLNSVSSYMDYSDCSSKYHHYIPYQSRNVAGQHPYYVRSYLSKIRKQRNCFLYNHPLSEMEMASLKGIPFVQKEYPRPSYYLSNPMMEKVEELNYTCNAIDNSIISQAQNSKIDFSEIKRLNQKYNILFKKPNLPPVNALYNTYEINNMNLKLDLSGKVITNSASNQFYF